MKAMLISIGVGSGADSAIAVSIKNHNPDRVAFLASEGSLATIDAVAEKLNHPASIGDVGERIVFVAKNYEDLNSCYEEARKAALWLIELGAAPEDCVADFTSGTKSMSIAVSLVAVQMGFRSLSYVGGEERDPQTGRVLKGAERVFVASPFRVEHDRAVEQAAELFNLFQFDACLQIVERYKRTFSEQLIPKLIAIGHLAQFYKLWDRFEHVEASKTARHLEAACTKLGVWTEDMQSFTQLACGLAAPKSEGMGALYVAADLLANADRRGIEGKFDDAVARLYRLMEYLAQHRLESEFGQKSGSIDKKWLEDKKLVDKYAANSAGKDTVKLGLRNTYELLNDLGDPLGKQFKANSRLQSLLESRNTSILAHGLQAVPKKVFEDLRGEVLAMCALVFGKDKFEKALTRCTFPKLPVGLAAKSS